MQVSKMRVVVAVITRQNIANFLGYRHNAKIAKTMRKIRIICPPVILSLFLPVILSEAKDLIIISIVQQIFKFRIF